MKRIFAISLVVAALSGCRFCRSASGFTEFYFFSSPYDHIECWLIREDPIRPFAIPADIFYVQSDLASASQANANISLLYSYVKAEVGNGRFNGFARVFAPLVASADDLEEAFRWYLYCHHEQNRPFIFIGDGEGGKLLQEYENEHFYDLKEDGLVASFYTEGARKGFITDEMIKAMKSAVSRARFRLIHGRDCAEDR